MEPQKRPSRTIDIHSPVKGKVIYAIPIRDLTGQEPDDALDRTVCSRQHLAFIVPDDIADNLEAIYSPVGGAITARPKNQEDHVEAGDVILTITF